MNKNKEVNYKSNLLLFFILFNITNFVNNQLRFCSIYL